MNDKVISLSEEPFRILQKLCETDPTTEAYYYALQNLRYLVEVIPGINPANLQALTNLAHIASGQESPAPLATDMEKPSAPAPTVAPTPAPQTTAEDSGLTKVQLREELAQLSNKHANLNVAAIMAEMGYQKLSEVPAERYEELRGKVLAVVGGAA